MENKVTTPAPAVNLPLSVIAARNAVIAAETKSYGARVEYARELNNMAGVAWYRDGAEKVISIETEKANLYAGLKAANHSNPSKVFSDIKKYALIDAQDRGLFGEVKPVADAKPAEGESTGNANANAPRPLNVRLIEEGITLWKACEKEKAFLTDGQRAYQMHLTKALEALKVNVGMIKVGK
jgi:hypothetical protein